MKNEDIRTTDYFLKPLSLHQLEERLEMSSLGVGTGVEGKDFGDCKPIDSCISDSCGGMPIMDQDYYDEDWVVG